MVTFTFLLYTITGTCMSSAQMDSARTWEDLRVCVKCMHDDRGQRVITDCHWGRTGPRSGLGALGQLDLKAQTRGESTTG